MNVRGYFSNNWFETTCQRNWESILPKLQPKKVLEIGSYEGKSAAYLIERLGSAYPFELYCVDSWSGPGTEYVQGGVDMGAVERRFYENTRIAGERVPNVVKVFPIKERSNIGLSLLIGQGHLGSFEFVYIDGSHEGHDVFADAVRSFELTKVGGIIGFDDVGIGNSRDPHDTVRTAVNIFKDMYGGRIRRVPSTPEQVYLEKLS